MATSSSSGRREQRGPMQRAAVLEDIIRTVPPEVAGQVETISKEEAKLVSGPRPGLRRSQTSTIDVWGHAEDGAAATGAPSDITLQRRCAQLESQLDKWVGIAQLLASELAYREKRLWEWQMDQTNTKVIMQKFKDRLKKGNRSGRGERPDGGAGASGPSPLARSAASAGTGGTLAKQPVAPGTPRTIPTSAHGISLLVIMPHEAEARALSQACSQMGYRVTVGTSGEEALDIVTQAQKRPRGFAAQGGSASSAPFELVLCDVELPGIPGVEVLNQLKEMLKNEVSVIMLATDLNSAAEAAAVERCIVEGADSYILKPPAPRELTALWGFVARKRQQASETEKLHDLNQVIRSVEDEIGTQQKRARSVAQLKAHNAEKSAATADNPATTPSAMPNPMWAQSRADPKPEQSFKKSSPTKKVVKWSMHGQFEEDLKADLADAHKQVLPEYGIGVNSAIFNPALEGAVNNCVTQLLGILHPGDTPKGDKKGAKEDKKCVECAPSSSAGVPVDRAGRPGVDSESDASFGPREGKDGKLAQPEKRKLRKGDSGNLRAMLLERRQSSVGRSSKELLTMLSILDGNEEDDGMEDELVLCRICEQQVLRSSLQLHTAICKATHKAKNDEEKATKEVKELLGLLQSTRRQALLSLMSIAVQRFNLMCAPLDKLQELGGQLLHNDDTNLSPLHHLGRLTELARELAMLKRAGGTEMGGSVFYSCASQLKAIIADKISNVQELIDLDPHALDFGATRSLNRGMAITGKLGIRDFKLIRMLATGGFAQVWLAKKKSTGDVMAIKAMRKEHLRDTDQVTSINVEHAILAKHDCEFLVRAFYSFRSAHHIYFALEYMPGGDLSSMLAECGCIAEPSAAFYVAETLLGMHYLHTKHILHRDIKPSNVLIAESGHIKLADFGLSTSMMQHKKCGTLPYVAPEVLRDGSASEALDYWAVGVLLYELTVGEPPFSGETPKLMLNAIMNTTINTQPLSPVASSLIRSLLQVDPALRLGASGIEEIQAHAFFAFTRWDKMMEATPPFVPQLAGGDDDAYFPQAFKADHDIDIDSDTSEEDPDDCGESFKQIQSVNVDHLISLARRPSSKALKAGQSVLTTPTDSTRDSTPVPSVPATPQQQPRSLKSPKPKPPPSKQPPSKGDLSKLSLSQLSQQQQQLEEQLSKLTKGDLGKVSQQQQQQLELHLGTKLKGPVSRPL